MWAEEVGYREEDIPGIIDDVRRKKHKGTTLKEYKDRKMSDPEFIKAYNEIKPDLDEIRRKLEKG